MANIFSYYDLIKDRNNFHRTAHERDGFNLLDTPGHKYFKLLFYFANGITDYANTTQSRGLLAPSWLTYEITNERLHRYNSAWSFLKMNLEDVRADLLRDFVTLLSDISSRSPWYFSEISGVDTALERKAPTENKFNIEESRKKISIKCLPDAFDDRIGTLLDLYRSIVWSWTWKREILPANLRKFDMGLFIFESTVAPYHIHNWVTSNSDKAIYSESSYIDTNMNGDMSYKYIEFHNCEFDYNSAKSGLTSINNKEGFQHEYTIDIFFDDCYEQRYNMELLHKFGDMLLSDIKYGEEIDAQDSGNMNDYNNGDTREYQDRMAKINDYHTYYKDKSNTNSYPHPQIDPPAPGLKNEQLPGWPGSKDAVTGWFNNAVRDAIDIGLDWVDSKLKRAVLGNLFTLSLTGLKNVGISLYEGDIWATASSIKNKVDSNRVIKDAESYFDTDRDMFPSVTPGVSDNPGNIFTNSDSDRLTAISEAESHFSTDRDIFPPVENKKQLRYIGNLFISSPLSGSSISGQAIKDNL